jgi:hypothetical protein
LGRRGSAYGFIPREVKFIIPSFADLSRKKLRAVNFFISLGLHNFFYTSIIKTMTNLVAQKSKKKELSEREELFLQSLFDCQGDIRRAAELAGYNPKSAYWLRDKLSEEIIERTRNYLAAHSLRAAQRVVDTVDNPDLDRGSDLRLKAANSILDRSGISAKQEHNHTVEAVHGVVLLPPKQEIVIDHEEQD